MRPRRGDEFPAQAQVAAWARESERCAPGAESRAASALLLLAHGLSAERTELGRGKAARKWAVGHFSEVAQKNRIKG